MTKIKMSGKSKKHKVLSCYIIKLSLPINIWNRDFNSSFSEIK